MNEWKISEKEINSSKFQKYESVSCLGNGYIGIRNSLEEDYIQSHRNTFINGVFNAPMGEVPELASLPDVTNFEICIDNERFDMLTAEITEYERSLDMKSGEAVRKLVWHKNGKSVRLEFRRFVSYTRKHITAQKVIVEPMSDAVLKIKSGIDGKITNTGVQHFGVTELRGYGDGTISLYTKTQQSEVGVSIKSVLSCNHENKYSVTTDRRSVFSNMELSVKANTKVEFEKLSAYATTRDLENENTAAPYLDEVREMGYDLLFEESRSDWHDFWDKNGIVIESDDAFYQKAINFALYHLRIMARGEDSRLGIGAKALSGEDYKGHSFWDTEIFILPYYLYTAHDTAKKLLEYRYKLLGASRKKAKEYGYEGAMYPWEGAWVSDGETCPHLGDMDLETGKHRVNLMGETEVHINADIAYAVALYGMITGDKEFMDKYGCEIILSTAEFWLSRAEQKNGRYEILNVIGPDEYKEDVDNNAYTNYMAYFNLVSARDILNNLSDEKIKELKERVNIEKLKNELPNVIRMFYLPKAGKDGIIEQFDGFTELEAIDTAVYKNRNKVGTIFDDYGFDRIKKMRVCKQADIVMLFYTLGQFFDSDEIKKNFVFYEDCTLHDSSLSMCIHSLVASRIGMMDMAQKMFYKCCCVDIGEDSDNSDNGIHSASIGGIWLAVVMGFGGVSVSEEGLMIRPVLPDSINEYSFPIEYRGTRLNVTVNKEGCKVNRKTGKPVEVIINGVKQSI